MTNKKVAAYTLGCKVNLYDTQAMLEQFTYSGYDIVDFADYADVYIINTCTVTNLSDKKSRQYIRRAVKTNPDAIVAAVGCYAQVKPDEVSQIEGVNLVLGIKDRDKIVELIENAVNTKTKNIYDIDKEFIYENLSVSSMQERTRAYIKIQEGCDRFCSYCIIPYARGPVRSRELSDIYNEAIKIVGNGYKEIVLAGIHVASYGIDKKDIDLLGVIKAIHEIDGLERIRMSSVEPTFVDDKLLKLISDHKKLCDHFHLSLQSGSAKTLAAMNRRYTPMDYARSVSELKFVMPDVSVTTDVIVGFPGETDYDFMESMEFCERVGLTKLHVFPYSIKSGTEAEKMPNHLTSAIKNERAAKMLELSDRLTKNFHDKFIDSRKKILIEQKENDYYVGHTTNYIPVQCKSDYDITNNLVDVIISSNIGNNMRGDIY